MIEIVLIVLPAVLINIMILAGLEHREKLYEDLIEHLDNLERSLSDGPIPKKNNSKDTAESTSTTCILKNDRPDKKHEV